MKKLAAAFAALLALCACGQHSSVMDEIAKGEREEMANAQANAQASAEFLEKNKQREGVQTTASGLQYEIVRKAAGDGPRPGPRDEVTVHYEGTLPNGKVFDSSYRRGQTISFGLHQVIPGWTEGLQLMRPGEEFRFYIPSNLAYGPGGAGADIGPNQALVFRVELFSFLKADGTMVSE